MKLELFCQHPFVDVPVWNPVVVDLPRRRSGRHDGMKKCRYAALRTRFQLDTAASPLIIYWRSLSVSITPARIGHWGCWCLAHDQYRSVCGWVQVYAGMPVQSQCHMSAITIQYITTSPSPRGHSHTRGDQVRWRSRGVQPGCGCTVGDQSSELCCLLK